MLYVHFPRTQEPPNAQSAPVKVMQGRTAFLKYKLAHTAEIPLLASCYNGTFSCWRRRSVNTPSAGICRALLSWESSRSQRRDGGRGSGVLVLCFLPTGKWQPLSCCRKQNAHSSLITHLETISHPFLHGGLVPAFPLRCFLCKATLMLLNQN